MSDPHLERTPDHLLVNSHLAKIREETVDNLAGKYGGNDCNGFIGNQREKWKSLLGFPGGSDGKASACNAGDPGSISGSGRSPAEGNGNPLYSLAWKIPWMEESRRLQSMGSQRVRHD